MCMYMMLRNNHASKENVCKLLAMCRCRTEVKIFTKSIILEEGGKMNEKLRLNSYPRMYLKETSSA